MNVSSLGIALVVIGVLLLVAGWLVGRGRSVRADRGGVAIGGNNSGNVQVTSTTHGANKAKSFPALDRALQILGLIVAAAGVALKAIELRGG